jgi:hypothetical protein
MKLTTQNLIVKLGWRGERTLNQNLSSDEKIFIKLKGAFGQGLAVTDKRIYIIKWGWMTGNLVGSKCITFEYKNVTGVHLKKGWTTGAFEVFSAATQSSNKGYWGSNAAKSDNIVTFNARTGLFQEATNFIRNKINHTHTNINSTTFNFSDLEKLAELRDKGIITAEEFDAKKKSLLAL